MKNDSPATVIAFPRSESLSPVRAASTPNPASAQILFFTGVRIERHIDEPAVPQTPSRAKRSATAPSRQRRRS